MTKSLSVEGCKQNSKIEPVYDKAEMNSEWKVNFIQSSSLNIQHS